MDTKKRNRPAEKAPLKKRYEAPAIIYREQLEVMATACTGGKDSYELCQAGPITS